MTDSDKLKEVLTRLKRWRLPDKAINTEEYWMVVECACDNAVDQICDTDEAIKQLIEFIETP